MPNALSSTASFEVLSSGYGCICGCIHDHCILINDSCSPGILFCHPSLLWHIEIISIFHRPVHTVVWKKMCEGYSSQLIMSVSVCVCICYIYSRTSTDMNAPIPVWVVSRHYSLVWIQARILDKGLIPQAAIHQYSKYCTSTSSTMCESWTGGIA